MRDEKLSILLITPAMYPKRVGGVGRVVYELSREFSRRGHIVYTFSVDDAPRIERKGLRTPSFVIAGSLKQIACRGKSKFDIVHAHEFPASVPALFVHASARLLTFHGPYSERISQLYGTFFGDIAWVVESFMVHHFDAITCVARSTIDRYKKRKINMIHIPNGVNLQQIDAVKKSIREYDPQILFVGRASPEKGYHVLKKAEKILGLRIKYLFNVPWETTIAYMKGSDLIVIPSLGEGLPLVLLEAMALNKKIVASNIDEIPLVLGNNGVLVPPGDPHALAEGIKKALDMPTPRTRSIIERSYTWSTIADRYLTLYSYILTKS
ncbi:MAG: glycosyltransferase family 4 protein [Candidatus Korarchaeota archaeon]